LPKAPGQIVQVIRYHHHLPIGDADKLVGIRRLRIAARLGVDAAGKLAIDLLDGVRHGHSLVVWI
jgi:hypothetical protein